MSIEKYAMFWGCVIPSRYPYIEKSVRLSFNDLGISFDEIDGFTCCPERSLVKTFDEKIWILSAARNLAVAENQGYNILTPCTGCFSVLKTVRAMLIGNAPLRKEINESLEKYDLKFTGKKDVMHIAEYLISEVSVPVISKKIKYPLWGLRIAPHFGCHLVRPSPYVRWDDSIHPTKFEELITALGATVVDYESKEVCCGSYLGRVGYQEGSLNFSRNKLTDIKEHNADAVAVVCPSCFQQFDLNQSILIRKQEKLGIPVVYLTQLLAIAFGHSPEDVGMSLHKVSASDAIEKILQNRQLRAFLEESFSLPEVEKCADCGACNEVCSSAIMNSKFDPNKVMKRVVQGDIEALLESDDIWQCVECELCHELCPQKYSMEKTFRILKRMAINKGIAPKQINSGISTYKESGLLGTPRESEREKLGLPKLPKYGSGQWKKMVADFGDKK